MSTARQILEAESARDLFTRLATKHRVLVDKRLHSKAAENGPDPSPDETLNDRAWWFRENLSWNDHSDLWQVESASSNYDFIGQSNTEWFERNLPGLFRWDGENFGIPDERRFNITHEQFHMLSGAVDSLSSYPLLDEDRYSELEYEAKQEFWEKDGRTEVKGALIEKFKGNSQVEMVLRLLGDKEFDHWALQQHDMDQHIEFQSGNEPYLHLRYALEGIDAADITGLIDEEALNEELARRWADRLFETWLEILGQVRRDDPRVVEAVANLPYERGWRLFRKLMEAVGAEFQFLDSVTGGLDKDFDVGTDYMKEMAMALRPEMLQGLQADDPRQLSLAIEQVLAGAPTFMIFEGFREKRALFVSQGHDEAEVDDVLSLFKQLKQRNLLQGEEADIDRYSDFGTLKSVLDQASQRASKTQQKRQVRLEQATVIRDDEDMTIVVPKTRAAACQYGKGTKWCISAVNDNRWEQYHEKLAKHYMILRKNVLSDDPFYKITVSVYPDGEHSIYDALDRNMSAEQLRQTTGLNISDFGPWREDELHGRDLYRLFNQSQRDMPFITRVERMGEDGWAALGADIALREVWAEDQKEELKGLSQEEVDEQWMQFWMDARRDLFAHPEDEAYANHLRFYIE
jgi:hypothetical protein